MSEGNDEYLNVFSYNFSILIYLQIIICKLSMSMATFQKPNRCMYILINEDYPYLVPTKL